MSTALTHRIPTVINDKPNVTIRPVRPSDLDSLEHLANTEGWGIGVHNLRLYYNTSPQGWTLAETNDGQIVGYSSYNCLSNGISFVYELLVRSDYRGKGLTRMFNIVDNLNLTLLANVTAASILRYSSLSRISWKIVGFKGNLARERIPKFTINIAEKIVKLSPTGFQKLCEYDRKILFLDRSEFLRQYTMPDDRGLANCFMALGSNGFVRGYGVLRLCRNYYSISPVYADTLDIALMLLLSLCKLLPEHTSLEIVFPAQQLTTLKFCHELGLSQSVSQIRAYRPGAFELYGNQLKLDRVYAIHEFWPL